MTNNTSNNNLIAKNTVYLYFRTILIMIVSLYMSRVVLQTLGVEDYGVYNAVGGVVTMFAVISGALSNAISRYITYALGKNDDERLNTIFCTGLNIQIIISIAIIILCELIGVWFLNTKMNIPPDRIYAANWVLQCSLLTFVINLISVPYNACIIAHEHMNAYAYISIADALLKLFVAFLIIIAPYDKLIVYSILLVIVSLIVRLIYGFYCSQHFKETRYRFVYEKSLFREMLSFAGWNFFGNTTSVLNTQGVNLLINVYFGVIVNSARGIASQVEAAVNQFVISFSTAINPQITKSYAYGDYQRLFYLVCKGAKYSFFLLLLIALPLLFEANNILEIWLGSVPDGAALFMQLTLIGVMVNTLGNSGYIACMATGNIKKYSIVITIIGSLNFILTWIAYKLGAPAETTYIIYIGVYIVVLIARLFLMRDLFEFPIKMYIKEVIGRIITPSVLALVIPYLLRISIESSFIRVLIVCPSSLLWTAICVYYLGLTKGERIAISSKIKYFFLKRFR